MITFAAAGLSLIMALPTAAVTDVKPCKDPVIAAIREAGWKGIDQRTAYGIAWRESNLRPDVVGAGSYGLFQLQASAWSGRSWWDWDAVLTASGNSRMAHKIWRLQGWMPWGITRDGDGVDATLYGSWGADGQYAWIWAPYVTGLRKYDRLPKGCR